MWRGGGGGSLQALYKTQVVCSLIKKKIINTDYGPG